MEFAGLWLLFGIAGAAIMLARGRSGCGGFLLGLSLGPIGLIVALAMRRAYRAEKIAWRGEAPAGDQFVAAGMIGPYPYRDAQGGRVEVLIQGGVTLFPSRKAAEKALSR